MSRAPRKTASGAADDAPPESDIFEGAPHPRTVEHLIGHEEAERVLLSAYLDDRMAQSWIIGGREGIGKATLAWRLARFVLTYPDPQLFQARGQASLPDTLHVDPQHPVARRISAMAHSDVFVLRRAWNEKEKKLYTEIRVEDARRLIERFHQASSDGGWRVAIVDCAEDLNRNTANALLKLIEEPPPRSLFLFIANRPAQVLATIRSRSRMLLLKPLAQSEIVQAIGQAGEPWSEMPEAEVAAAAARSGGSVRDAMRLLSGSGVRYLASVEALLDTLDSLDWAQVHKLADQVVGRENTDKFEAAVGAIYDWLDRRVLDGAGRGGVRAANLAPLAEVWEKTARSVRETEALNLDRRLLILTLFNDLSVAARRSA
jgi:DNA polymerase III subunit delta'